MMSDVAIPLMLATLTDQREFGDDWLLERKFDGERCVARKDGDAVRLESRTAKDLEAAKATLHQSFNAKVTQHPSDGAKPGAMQAL